ncbi:phosphatase PAP2 family protein [Streptomyces luteoverticillatus]|uniref:phosphatase PAP2 family protein n=1 Tax=Streptomyces luteoverticillatus TaxID=66425 RepID=UPI001F0C2508|nr:phosphatase PAP2 family protein [Streptomyces luteoverticillatus]
MPYVRHWLRNSILLFAAAIVLGLVAAHTTLIQPHDLSLDRTIQTNLRTSWLNHAMELVSYCASPVAGVLILAAWSGWLLFVRRRPTAAVSTFLVVAVGWNSTQIAKAIVARERPPRQFSLDPEIGSNSFPSGHTAFTVAAVVAAYFLLRETRHRRTVLVGGVLAVLLVAFSRMYIGAHYPTDTFGSVLIAGSAILFVTGVWHAWLLPRLDTLPLVGPLLARFGLAEERAALAPAEDDGHGGDDHDGHPEHGHYGGYAQQAQQAPHTQQPQHNPYVQHDAYGGQGQYGQPPAQGQYGQQGAYAPYGYGQQQPEQNNQYGAYGQYNGHAGQGGQYDGGGHAGQGGGYGGQYDGHAGQGGGYGGHDGGHGGHPGERPDGPSGGGRRGAGGNPSSGGRHRR